MWRHNGRNLWKINPMPHETPDGMVTLWRGLSPDQLDPEKGMLSSDLQAGKEDAIHRLVEAINAGDKEYVCCQVRHHTHNGYANLHGLTTPFVSVGLERTARNYCRTIGEMLAKIVVHRDRVIPGGLWANELLVIGGVTQEEIVQVDVVGTEPPSAAQPDHASLLTRKLEGFAIGEHLMASLAQQLGDLQLRARPQ